jgi:3-hydroxyisobutyrate dehydrogenase-like beta-hydroxyacid dehydrogenase
MGISVAASAHNSGNTVYWASQDRSPETYARAEKYNLVDAGTLAGLCQACSVIISVCPPHAAEDVAGAVVANRFQGLYVDANAIAPSKVQHIDHMMAAAGIEFVDGGIIGGPAWQPGETWLYLSGPRASQVAELFSAGPLETEVIGDEPGRASALKMCYAAYTKGSTAMLSAILGLAHQLGVWELLRRQWELDDPAFAEQAVLRARRVTAKAWRFAGEMDEIALTFLEAGLPGGFHQAAGEVYSRISGFKGMDEYPPIEDVLAALTNSDPLS